MSSLSLSIKIGAIFSGINELSKAITSTTSLNNKIKNLKNQKINLASKFKDTVLESKRLNQYILLLSNNAKKLNNSLKLENNIKSYREKFKGALIDKIALGAAIIAPIKIGIDYESAMADVKKVVNFKDNEELANFSNQIVKLSSKIPLNANELATIVASGGQLGIAKEKLLDFTTITAKMSTAFDMLPSEAGEASAKLMNNKLF